MYKILIADDEIKICESICDYMSAKGLTVFSANDGISAVELCENNDFDLIILDVMMPKMNGLQACKQIREFSSAPILFYLLLARNRTC